MSPSDAFVNGRWYESWYVKAVLELGVLGLIALALLLASLLRRLLRAHKRIADPNLRSISAALIAFWIWHLVYSFKGPFLDIDPANVYFWLLGGICVRLYFLDRPQASHPVEARRQGAALRPAPAAA
jgi:O-antigen ligase